MTNVKKDNTQSLKARASWGQHIKNFTPYLSLITIPQKWPAEVPNDRQNFEISRSYDRQASKRFAHHCLRPCNTQYTSSRPTIYYTQHLGFIMSSYSHKHGSMLSYRTPYNIISRSSYIAYNSDGQSRRSSGHCPAENRNDRQKCGTCRSLWPAHFPQRSFNIWSKLRNSVKLFMKLYKILELYTIHCIVYT